MRFIDSYKRLEKTCNEMYSDNHGLSSYIEDMKNNPVGSHYVSGWNDDLKQLKHYRWIRNQIAHEPGRTEENMCNSKDELWIKNFHSRIIKQTDPLAMYRKATRPGAAKRAQHSRPSQPRQAYTSHTPKQDESSSKAAGWLTFLIIAALVGLSILFIYSLK